MENPKKNSNTTIAVSFEENQRLSAFCKRNKMTKKAFIPIAIQYFENNGINPKIHSEPKAEMEQINKRINQLFAFIKTQEKEFFLPAIQAIVSTENTLNKNIQTLCTRQDLIKSFSNYTMNSHKDDLKNSFKEMLHENNKNQKEISENISVKIEAFHGEMKNELEQIKTKKGFSF